MKKLLILLLTTAITVATTSAEIRRFDKHFSQLDEKSRLYFAEDMTTHKYGVMNNEKLILPAVYDNLSVQGGFIIATRNSKSSLVNAIGEIIYSSNGEISFWKEINHFIDKEKGKKVCAEKHNGFNILSYGSDLPSPILVADEIFAKTPKATNDKSKFVNQPLQPVGLSFYDSELRNAASNSIAYPFTKLTLIDKNGKPIDEERPRNRLIVGMHDTPGKKDGKFISFQFTDNSENTLSQPLVDSDGKTMNGFSGAYMNYSDCVLLVDESTPSIAIFDNTDGGTLHISLNDFYFKFNGNTIKFEPFFETETFYLGELYTNPLFALLSENYLEYISTVGDTDYMRNFIQELKKMPWSEIEEVSNSDIMSIRIEILTYQFLTRDNIKHNTPKFGLG